MPLPFPFIDNYADLESVALLVLEPAKKSPVREKGSERVREGAKEREWERGSEINVNFLQSVLQNPLSALSEFNWRGERMMEQLEKHNVSYFTLYLINKNIYRILIILFLLFYSYYFLLYYCSFSYFILVLTIFCIKFL